MNIEKAKQVQAAVCAAAKRLASSNLVAGTWGNISARLDDDYMVVTPSGMPYEILKPGDMVIVNMHDLTHEGNLKPTVEAPMHAMIMLERPEVNAAVHTHSTYALVMAAAHKPIPPICDDQVQILGGEVRVARYTLPGTGEMAEAVAEALRGRMGALIANHGAVALGRNLDEAFTAAIVLEKAAQVYVGTQALGGGVELSQEDIAFMYDFFMNKYGQR
ncbi:MAG TPA: class II aldolase/adducin family protein [Thermoclostridium sp.]|nr:class II aldolase/adducin family protein [Thermoclostridium sp.]HPU44611.1 class II aldolase/adducin family protein [Thermoclostridium sp.]